MRKATDIHLVDVHHVCVCVGGGLTTNILYDLATGESDFGESSGVWHIQLWMSECIPPPYGYVLDVVIINMNSNIVLLFSSECSVQENFSFRVVCFDVDSEWRNEWRNEKHIVNTKINQTFNMWCLS